MAFIGTARVATRIGLRSRIVVLLAVLALIAAACGVPDEVASAEGEVTLDSLTPIAPAEEATVEPEPEDDEDDDVAEETDTTTTSDATTTTEAPETSEPEPETTSVAPTTETTEEPDEAAADEPDDEPAATTSTTAAETTTTSTTSTTSTTEAPTTTTVAPSARALTDIDLELELVASLSSPVTFGTRQGSADIFVGEQSGRIVRLPNGTADGADTTLDLRGSVSLGMEQGLLGFAFAPNGQRLYAHYTNTSGSSVISRFDVSGNSVVSGSQEVLLTIPQPFGNHNGGRLAFGSDGLLYIGLGDGGSSGDPQGHGQNPNTLLGSVLRIDVSGQSGYTIPPGNPFANGGGAPEIFVWGIRNAWRLSFDPANGDLWIADVGQDRMEEVTVLRVGTGSGANLGWNLVEGTESFRGQPAPAGHVGPILTYSHGSGRCSITGGEVYRGDDIAGLGGTYLYGDFCTGEVFGFRANGGGTPQRLDLPAIDRLSAFGLDSSGEAYVLSRGGGVFRVVEP